MKIYYLVFTDGCRWMHRLLKKHYSHVYVLTKDEYNWVMLNPMKCALEVFLPPFPLSESLPIYGTKTTDTVIEIIFAERDLAERQHSFFGLANCVTCVKYMVGLRLFCLTPFSLFQRLLRFPPKSMAKQKILSIKRVK